MTAEYGDQYRYRAFISYSHKDEAWARWLHGRLERYHVPKALVGRETPLGPVPRRIFPVFRDRDELPTASDLSSMIDSALSLSAAMIVVCSPNSAASHWVDAEIRQFKRLGRKELIQALIVSGEPNAGDKGEGGQAECFPPSLRFAVREDGELTEERSEPIAADARAGKDGKEDSFLKLTAGILGIGYDDLKKREQRRKRKRAAILSAAGSILFSVMAALTVLAVQSRNLAVEARKEAEERRRQAISAQQEAETQKDRAVAARSEAETQRAEAEAQKNAALKAREETEGKRRELALSLAKLTLEDAKRAMNEERYSDAAVKALSAIELAESSGPKPLPARRAKTRFSSRPSASSLPGIGI
jgi:hypothetical protein